jgi:Mannose-6-phosphate isomerase
VRSFDTRDAVERLRAASGGYEIVHESPGLELGVYVLVAPEPDRQQPHQNDEVYVVLEGTGTLEVEGDRVDLREGQAVFVPPARITASSATSSSRCSSSSSAQPADPGIRGRRSADNYRPRSRPARIPPHAEADDAGMPRTDFQKEQTMKISLLVLAVTAAVCAAAFGAGRAPAATSHQAAPKTLNIYMRDPGCHWFRIGGSTRRRPRSTAASGSSTSTRRH